MARRRLTKRHRSSLKRSWAKKTRKGAKYRFVKASVRRKVGKKKHVKGRSWTGRKGTVVLRMRKSGKVWATNPRRRKGARRNPSIGAAARNFVVAPVMALPKSLPNLFKGSVVTNGAFAAGGAITALAGGTALQQVIMNLLNKVAPGAMASVMSKGIVQRIVGASFALVAGGVVGQFAIKKPASRAAFITGTAAAALAEALFPGRVASIARDLPIVGQYIVVPASPVQGLMGLYGSDMLAAYVEAPAYQGVGAYVEAPAYQGVGDLGASMDDAVAGLGSNDMLAGAIGSNMASHLDG